ncbi:hypothetical protein J2W30_004677 [Variovorax boronicumulans]|nr:hypothetical protein [Variovorax boronicumulans]
MKFLYPYCGLEVVTLSDSGPLPGQQMQPKQRAAELPIGVIFGPRSQPITLA